MQYQSHRAVNVQDVFLNHVRKNRVPLTVFLVNGIKLHGLVTWFDSHSILLKKEGHSQLVYKHAVSTIMPHAAVQLFEQKPGGSHNFQKQGGRRGSPYQDDEMMDFDDEQFQETYDETDLNPSNEDSFDQDSKK